MGLDTELYEEYKIKLQEIQKLIDEEEAKPTSPHRLEDLIEWYRDVHYDIWKYEGNQPKAPHDQQ